MTEAELNTIAAWIRSECRRPIRKVLHGDIAEYAESLGIPIHAQDYIVLFHHLNSQKDYA